MYVNGTAATCCPINLSLMSDFRLFLLGTFLLIAPVIGVLQPRLALTPPRLSHAMVMTGVQAPVLEADFRMVGAVLRYTSNGTNPVNTSPVMSSQLPLRYPCTIKVTAFHPDFAPSVPAEVSCFLAGKPMRSFYVSAPAGEYRGSDSLLTDHSFGTTNFKKDYLGFQGDTTVITIETDPWQSISTLHLTGLTNTGAWIFPPEKILVTDAKGALIAEMKLTAISSDSQVKKWHEQIALPASKYQKIQVHIPPGKLPAWHQGNGQAAWLFLDEVWLE